MLGASAGGEHRPPRARMRRPAEPAPSEPGLLAGRNNWPVSPAESTLPRAEEHNGGLVPPVRLKGWLSRLSTSPSRPRSLEGWGYHRQLDCLAASGVDGSLRRSLKWIVAWEGCGRVGRPCLVRDQLLPSGGLPGQLADRSPMSSRGFWRTRGSCCLSRRPDRRIRREPTCQRVVLVTPTGYG